MILGHAGAPLAPHDLPAAWNLDLTVAGAIVILVALYGWSVGRWWRHRGVGAVLGARQVATFAAGVLALLVALVSPLDALSGALFGAHMVQHLMLTVVVAPLLLLGRVHVALQRVLPLSVRRRWGRRSSRAAAAGGPVLIVGAVAGHVLTVIAWHVPVLYDLALASPWVHVAEHATLLVTAVGFWAAVGASRPRPVAAAAPALFAASVSFVLLAALLTSAQEPWFGAHLATTAAFRLTPIQDQHLAAAIMWVPGGIVYLAAGAAAIVRWIRADERELALSRTDGRS